MVREGGAFLSSQAAVHFDPENAGFGPDLDDGPLNASSRVYFRGASLLWENVELGPNPGETRIGLLYNSRSTSENILPVTVEVTTAAMQPSPTSAALHAQKICSIDETLVLLMSAIAMRYLRLLESLLLIFGTSDASDPFPKGNNQSIFGAFVAGPETLANCDSQ